MLRCRPLADAAPHLFTTSAVTLRGDGSEWQRVAAALGVSAGALRLLHQVHGRDVAIARHGDPVPAARPEVDAIASDDRASAVGVRVADCAPILFADPTLGVVAAAHAGWRGALQRVAAAAVDAMQASFGSDPANVIAAIGPSLGACCGEMGPEVVEEFRDAGHTDADIDRWFAPGPRGRPHFDLGRANVDQLVRAGVPPASIHLAGLCTKCRPDLFHSYRVAGAGAGRMLGAIRPS